MGFSYLSRILQPGDEREGESERVNRKSVRAANGLSGYRSKTGSVHFIIIIIIIITIRAECAIVQTVLCVKERRPKERNKKSSWEELAIKKQSALLETDNILMHR